MTTAETTATVHDLLLALAGRLDDDLLAWARELLAVGEQDQAVELATAALAAERVALPASLRSALVAAARTAHTDLDVDAALPPAATGPGTAHRFDAAAAPGDALVAALTALPARRLAGCRLHLTWRRTPAGTAPGPVPRAVVLVAADPDRSPDVLAYLLATELDRAGTPASVEVFTTGAPLPAYHAAALRSAHEVVLRGAREVVPGTPSRGASRGDERPDGLGAPDTRSGEVGPVPGSPLAGSPPSGFPPSGFPPSGSPPSGSPPSGSPPSGSPVAGPGPAPDGERRRTAPTGRHGTADPMSTPLFLVPSPDDPGPAHGVERQVRRTGPGPGPYADDPLVNGGAPAATRSREARTAGPFDLPAVDGAPASARYRTGPSGAAGPHDGGRAPSGAAGLDAPASAAATGPDAPDTDPLNGPLRVPLLAPLLDPTLRDPTGDHAGDPGSGPQATDPPGDDPVRLHPIEREPAVADLPRRYPAPHDPEGHVVRATDTEHASPEPASPPPRPAEPGPPPVEVPAEWEEDWRTGEWAMPRRPGSGDGPGSGSARFDVFGAPPVPGAGPDLPARSGRPGRRRADPAVAGIDSSPAGDRPPGSEDVSLFESPTARMDPGPTVFPTSPTSTSIGGEALFGPPVQDAPQFDRPPGPAARTGPPTGDAPRPGRRRRPDDPSSPGERPPGAPVPPDPAQDERAADPPPGPSHPDPEPSALLSGTERDLLAQLQADLAARERRPRPYRRAGQNGAAHVNGHRTGGPDGDRPPPDVAG